jgi:hypothetical protein
MSAIKLQEMKERYFDKHHGKQPVIPAVHTNAGINNNYTTRITAITTTELTTDSMIICDSLTAITVNLLPATGSNRIRQIANINIGIVTVDGDGGDTINGELNQLLYQGSCMDIKDYVTGKFVII